MILIWQSMMHSAQHNVSNIDSRKKENRSTATRCMVENGEATSGIMQRQVAVVSKWITWNFSCVHGIYVC